MSISYKGFKRKWMNVEPTEIDTPWGIVKIKTFAIKVNQTEQQIRYAEVWFHRTHMLFEKYPVQVEGEEIKLAEFKNDVYEFVNQYATEVAYWLQGDFVPNATKFLNRFRKRGRQHWYPRMVFGRVSADDGITDDLKYKLLSLIVGKVGS